jgi:hypothetical protein
VKLPNAENALITDEKLYGFLVNRDHPRQAGHAELFFRLLGIDESNAENLRTALLDAARKLDAVPGQPSDFGVKYEIRFEMTSPRGVFTILSIWMIRSGEDSPRLVTAYILRD